MQVQSMHFKARAGQKLADQRLQQTVERGDVRAGEDEGGDVRRELAALRRGVRGDVGRRRHRAQALTTLDAGSR